MRSAQARVARRGEDRHDGGAWSQRATFRAQIEGGFAASACYSWVFFGAAGRFLVTVIIATAAMITAEATSVRGVISTGS